MAATSPVAQHGNEWSLHVDFSAVPLTGEQFYRLSTDNPELRLELTAEGELILMSPTGAKTGHRNSELNYQLVAWAKADGRGLTFVAELRSPSDTLTTLQAKMREYLDNGAKLGWLLDPIEKRVYIYRQGEDVECLEEPQSIDGENVLAGLVLDLHEIV